MTRQFEMLDNETDRSVMPGLRFGKIYGAFKHQPRTRDVPRFLSLSIDDFRNNVLPIHAPAVFSFSNATLTKQEALKILVNELSELTVRPARYESAEKYISKNYQEVLASEYISKELDLDPCPRYAGGVMLPEATLANLGARPPLFFSRCKYKDPVTWLGGAGCQTPLHKDGSSNFAVHLFGAKRWRLFPPRDIPFLAMKRVVKGTDFAVSTLPTTELMRTKSKDYSKAVPVEVVVNGGEMLFLPEGWGHEVETIAPTLMVSYWLL